MPTLLLILLTLLILICASIQNRLREIGSLLKRFFAAQRQTDGTHTCEDAKEPTHLDQAESIPMTQVSEASADVEPRDKPVMEAPHSPTSDGTQVPRLEQSTESTDTTSKTLETEPNWSCDLHRRFWAKRFDASLELRLGIRWAVVVGSITVLVGILFLLKSALKSFLSTPQGKVMVIAIAGFTALLVGEFTRRRNFGFVAKGLTALGFAILYTAVFSSYAYFDLTPAYFAFILAVCITASALAYAVVLDEVVMAVLALLGGFLSPLLLSMNTNRPHALFAYIVTLSLGAMGCSVFRKWRPVNVLSFTGAFMVYHAWYLRHYAFSQLNVALSWLVLLFIIFLIVPILYELLKKVVTRKEAAVLVLLNALVVLGYLAAMLYESYPKYLAGASVFIALAHFFVLLAVTRLCPQDRNLPPILVAIALFCLAVAVPLYFDMYATVMVFGAKAAILSIIGLKYKNRTTRIFSYIILALASLWLIAQLPLHDAEFHIFLNTPFISWLAIAASFYVFHVVHRLMHAQGKAVIGHSLLPEYFYLSFLGILICAIELEWFSHLSHNLQLGFGREYLIQVLRANVIVIAGSVILTLVKPFSPSGPLCKRLARLLGIAGTALASFALILFHEESFTIFINTDFLLALVMVVSLFAAAAMLRYQQYQVGSDKSLFILMGLLGIVLLWLLLTEEIYLYWYLLAEGAVRPDRCMFLGQMCISIMWAIYATFMVAVGLWRRITSLRLLSLALYVIILVKVFVFDMAARMSTAYRIAGFIVLGLALIGVSFLYQFCRNKGFFDNKESSEPEASGS